MKTNILFFILFVLLFKNNFAQNITAYKDDRNHLYFFNNGQKTKLEYQPVTSLKTGYNNIGYINSRNELIYYSIENKKVNLGFVHDFLVSDNLCSFTQNSALSTVKNGKKLLLTNDVGVHETGDSLIAYNDHIKQGVYVFYKNEIIELENNIIDEEVDNLLAKENTLAYFNPLGYFKVFNHGKLTEIDRPSIFHDYKIGLNVVAYVNNDNETFNVFTKGEALQIEETIPTSFKCGDDLVAYVDNQDVFKINTKGQTNEIISYAPEHYSVVDKLIIYENLERFSVNYNNENYELENYWIKNYKADESSLAYIDNQGWLIYFHNGKKERITNQNVTSFSVNGNVLQYSLDLNRFPIRYKGKTY